MFPTSLSPSNKLRHILPQGATDAHVPNTLRSTSHGHENAMVHKIDTRKKTKQQKRFLLAPPLLFAQFCKQCWSISLHSALIDSREKGDSIRYQYPARSATVCCPCFAPASCVYSDQASLLPPFSALPSSSCDIPLNHARPCEPLRRREDVCALWSVYSVVRALSTEYSRCGGAWSAKQRSMKWG